ncbi:MAG: hypothetical protein E7458_09430 [Ruminococcaceae bacterium]|nr:hypothetical protein [Oscillospiraceae bacterium]
MVFHVAKWGCDRNPGAESAPFLTIQKAAAIAQPGDTVCVHAGVYREWVNPANGGTAEHRIVYESAGDGEVVITGAEPVANWTDEGDGVWRAEVPNTLFTYRNPYKELVYGDWLFGELTGNHLGDVYLNGKGLYERQSLDEVRHPTPWAQAKYPEDSLLCWYCESDDNKVTLWANFGGANPNENLAEITVRPFVFWPEKTGRDYITVRGFTLKQAATQWAPPTALQEGLIGPHWSKGWIIENNKISDSKCSGVSLGKDISTGDNEWSNLKFKFGTQREQEVIFRALHNNWHKDHIGSHIVRYNEISECEQAGIVGHLGCVFSEIYGNRIFNNHHKQTYHGAEVAGIKLHASIDVEIHDNIFYSNYRAVWFDWQAQGTHLYRNVMMDSQSEDLFIEVCHGPCMVDHNLFLSKMNFRNVAQGCAFAHNLFAGRMVINPDRGRQTPYHFPHETAVAGWTIVMGGDDRFYNNIFLRDDDQNNEPVPMGFFEHLPLKPRTAEEEEAEKKAKMDGLPTKNNAMLYPVGLGSYRDYPGPEDKFWEKPFGPGMREAHLPSHIAGNLYLNNAVPTPWEKNATVTDEVGIEYECCNREGKVKIKITAPDAIRGKSPDVITTDLLGKTYHAEMKFENPDGTPYRFGRDFFGNSRPEKDVTPGPFELGEGESFEFVL